MSNFPTLDQRAIEEEERETAEVLFELQTVLETVLAEVLADMGLARESTLH